MLSAHTDQLPLSELASDPQRVLGVGASDATLHYCSPAHGGWGVVRTGLLVPESYLLFVCPAACGRHGAIAAFEQGYKDRVGYLCLADEEISLGSYQDGIAKGVSDVLDRLCPKPRAFMVCVSCIDDLLGTDHDGMLAELERRHGLPVRLARMNPIALDGKLPPTQRIQKTIYEFLEPAAARDGGINLLGCFTPVERGGDLEAIVASLGGGPLRHPGSCRSFDEYQTMGSSSRCIVVRPEGNAAAEQCETKLGMDVIKAPIAYSESLVFERLAAIAEFLGGRSTGDTVSPGTFAERASTPFAEAARTVAGRAARALSGASVAIDSTASASPFDLALALTEAGINVTRVYAEKLPAHDVASFARLAEMAPSLIVVNPSHGRRHAGRPAEPLADVAIGFAAGYATAAPRTYPLAFDEGLYGHAGRTGLFAALERCALSEATSLEDQVKAYGLVI